MPDFILYIIVFFSLILGIVFVVQFFKEEEKKYLSFSIGYFFIFCLSSVWFSLALSGEKSITEIHTLQVLTENNSQFVRLPYGKMVNLNTLYGRIYGKNDKFLYKKFDRWSYGVYFFLFSEDTSFEPILVETSATTEVIVVK